MSAHVEFHFEFGSPNAYLCHKVLPAIAARTGATFVYVPVLLGGVFKLTNNQPPMVQFKGIRNKAEYAQLETQRFIIRHGITQFRRNPHFPVNTVQIMRGPVLSQRDGFFERYVDQVFLPRRVRTLHQGGVGQVPGRHQGCRPRRIAIGECRWARLDSICIVFHRLRGVNQLRTTHTMSQPDIAWQQLISALHASGRKAALAITGGGSGAIGELLRVPGGSRLLVEAQVPYDAQALAAFLGFAPAQACSAGTAIAMARSARERATRLAPADADLVGLGATAALVSDRPRHGEHRFHIAFANAASIAHCTGVMAKGRRDRAAEEDLVSRAIVLWLARACGIAAPSPRSLFDGDEHFAETVVATVDAIDQLLAGEFDRVTAQPDGQMMLSAPRPAVLLPGSFNPVHTGHVLLAQVAAELKQQPLAFEISITNVDKPPLAGNTVRQRLAQFAWKSPLELTRAATFVEKSRLFPRTTFVIGADTAERLVAPKYYGDDEVRMHAALAEIGNSGGSFLVAARIDAARRLRTLSDIPVPRRYADLFTEIPEHRFRLDTSSSAIRARAV